MAKLVVLIIAIIALVVMAGGWYLISPAFQTTEANEESPLIIRDSMTTMTDEELAEFEEAVNIMSDQTIEMSGLDLPPHN